MNLPHPEGPACRPTRLSQYDLSQLAMALQAALRLVSGLARVEPLLNFRESIGASGERDAAHLLPDLLLGGLHVSGERVAQPQETRPGRLHPLRRDVGED